MERKGFIGGTDIAAIMGVHPYRNALQVYAEKLDLMPPFEGNEATWLGTILEPHIANWYAENQGVELAPEAKWVDPDVPYFAGHPDRIIVGKKQPVEIKTVGQRSASRWGDPGTDEVPEEYLMQCQWYMMLTESERCDIAVGFLQSMKAIYTVERSDALIDQMRDAGQAFWTKHIIPGLPPEPGDVAPDSLKAALRALYPEERKPMLRADARVEAMAMEYHSLDTELKRLESEKARIQGVLQSLIGDAAGVEGAFGRIDWKTAKGTIAWKKVADKLFDLVGMSNEARTQMAEAERVASSRRFRAFWSKEV